MRFLTKSFLIVTTLFATVNVATAQIAQQPLTFWRYAGDKVQLQAALDCAIGRLRAATCIPGLDVSYDAAHWVRQDLPENMPGATGITSGGFNSTRIKLASDIATDDKRCQILIHEIVHVIRRDYGHPGPLGSMSYPVTNTTAIPRSRITPEDIGFICAKQNCQCFNPEPPVVPVVPVTT